MARKSKYEHSSAKLSTTLWKPALYIRLSREDGDREESNSIASQRELLTEFVDTQTDMAAPRLYTDDGCTGTDFDRPDFQRMLNDLRAGIINCVIVKDLSRFGRNYVGVGEYLEHVFPLLNVRFISVSDNVDSYLDPRSVNNLVVPFKNILNDEYARDISNKVRASLDLKRRQGKFIGSFASYGYRKDPDDHSRLLIDEAAAAVVRDQQYSRDPVTGKDFDDVLGFVHVRDLLDIRDPEAKTVADVTREGISLPGTSKLLPSLELLRKRGIHLAVVIDEYGGTDGIVTLEGTAQAVGRDGKTTDVPFKAIPYSLWNNRGAAQMAVWIPTSPEYARPEPLPTIASRARTLTIQAPIQKDAPESAATEGWAWGVNDQWEPKRSSDTSKPYHYWWLKRGTEETLAYDFDQAYTVSGVEVYWLDFDHYDGNFRVPASWKLYYKDGGSWKEVEAITPYTTTKDTYNCLDFKPVRTTGLKIAAQLQKGESGGVLEWKVIPATE